MRVWWKWYTQKRGHMEYDLTDKEKKAVDNKIEELNNPPLAQMVEATVLNSVQSEFESLKGDHPIYKNPEWKIYGPYQNKEDLRRRVIAYDGTRNITISYPKFIMECYLKRLLNKDEEVHHKNNLEFDDKLSNYEILNGAEHKHLHKNPDQFFLCPVCNTLFKLTGYQISRRATELKRKPNMKGPYCSRSCSGKVNN